MRISKSPYAAWSKNTSDRLIKSSTTKHRQRRSSIHRFDDEDNGQSVSDWHDGIQPDTQQSTRTVIIWWTSRDDMIIYGDVLIIKTLIHGETMVINRWSLVMGDDSARRKAVQKLGTSKGAIYIEFFNVRFAVRKRSKTRYDARLRAVSLSTKNAPSHFTIRCRF
jgi:hypothetical protein